MEQAHLYIKRLLAFAVCLIVFFFSADFVPVYLSIPVLILAFSLLHSRITGDKPPHLFAFYRTDAWFKKGGLRDLIRIFVSLFGFIYDVAVWAVWGVYLIFLLFTDLLDLLRSIIFWIIHALLWFLRQYVPFLVFLYRIFIHYLIRWPWWLYQIAYFNIRYAFNKNSLRIALRGTILALLIIFAFYYLELMVASVPGIAFIGIIISLLPLSWSFGELAALRANNMEQEAFPELKKKFQNGIETVRSVLFYVTLFVVLLLTQLGLNLLGWIPDIGVPIGGFLFNLNTLISLFLIIICVLIVLGVIMIPSYRLYQSFNETKLDDSSRLLSSIFRKILQYLVISIPNTVFSGFILLIPLVVIMMAAGFTYKLKNFTIDLRIEQLKTEQAENKDAVEAYVLNQKTKRLENLKRFPRDVSQELMHQEILKTELSYSEEDLKLDKKDLLKNTTAADEKIELIKVEIEDRTLQDSLDPLIPELQFQLKKQQGQLSAYQENKEVEIAKLEADVDLLKLRIWQVPLMFLFGGLWLVIFGSFVLAFILAYLGHVYHQVFIFRNDDSSSEWMSQVRTIREKDSKQPLLGGTLFIVTLVVLIILLSGWIEGENLYWRVVEWVGI